MRFAALILAAFVALCASAEPIAVPKLTGRVVDLTGTLTTGERGELEAKLADFESVRGSQVAVLLVPSIGTETIEEFAGRVTDEWQLGRKGVEAQLEIDLWPKEKTGLTNSARVLRETIDKVL